MWPMKSVDPSWLASRGSARLRRGEWSTQLRSHICLRFAPTLATLDTAAEPCKVTDPALAELELLQAELRQLAAPRRTTAFSERRPRCPILLPKACNPPLRLQGHVPDLHRLPCLVDLHPAALRSPDRRTRRR